MYKNLEKKINELNSIICKLSVNQSFFNIQFFDKPKIINKLMSQQDLHQIHTSEQLNDSIRQRDHHEPNNIVEQVINNSVFRMLLKDMVQEIFIKKNLQDQEDKINSQTQIGVDGFIEEIGDSLMLIAQNQANKKIKEAEKFLQELYEHKVKQLQDRFEGIVQKKLKQLEIKMQKLDEQKTKILQQSAMLSPVEVRSPLKTRQILERSVCDEINRRMQLKQKILNNSTMPNIRNNSIVQVNSNSLFSQSLNDAVLQKLSQKIKQIQQNYKQEMKGINNKYSALRSQIKNDLQDTQNNIKEQINSGFEGIWNVISNLEKRMMIL